MPEGRHNNVPMEKKERRGAELWEREMCPDSAMERNGDSHCVQTSYMLWGIWEYRKLYRYIGSDKLLFWPSANGIASSQQEREDGSFLRLFAVLFFFCCFFLILPVKIMPAVPCSYLWWPADQHWSTFGYQRPNEAIRKEQECKSCSFLPAANSSRQLMEKGLASQRERSKEVALNYLLAPSRRDQCSPMCDARLGRIALTPARPLVKGF